MSAVMQATPRGRKHRCSACGAAFYDLERELSACPKCETPYAAAAHMPRGEPTRKRQSWSRGARPPEPGAAPEAPAAEAGEDDSEGVPVLDAVDDEAEAEEADDESRTTEDDETETPGPDQV